ncbi:signal recognition particle-docking protein FtsY [Roseomonas nepalensis]|uniref:Signal recognition particle receptor FtsY n=2 Tax=Muricoccus nepalensis TaxID=1854500 RepID=A0A502GHJ2_9PROT|nr:signal recognition particle-docking protein FtsY [Roseomonas nepalensis]
MALKDLWGRFVNRVTEPERPPEPPPAPPEEAPAALVPAGPAPGAGLPDHLLPPVPGLPGFTPPAPAPLPAEEGDFPQAPRPAMPGIPEEPRVDEPEVVEEPADLEEPEEDEAALPPSAPPEAPVPSGGFFARLKAGLSRSTARLTENLTGLFRKRRLDDEALEELEETLIAADLGLPAAQRIVAGFRRTRFGKEVGEDEVKAALAEEIASILEPVAQPFEPDWGVKPYVVLVVGVNGTGKTTTIAKLAQNFRAEGRRVMMAAGDTFRAAAVEQLQIWGERTGSTVVAPVKEGADAAGLAHEALQRARAEGADILLIDTAGRLHNKAGLMEELRKVVRVLRKLDEAVPHAVLLVLDATTGQNAVQQCKVFREMVDVTGLVVTKLDGSAKGGVVVALAEEFGLPVHAVGVGETAADLRPFEARDYARSLVGLS